MANSSAARLNVLGMLWYHGSKSQREAEASLESCGADCCYMVREYKGILYLSASHKGMYSHTPIPHTQQGYVLEGHHNAFRTLQELIAHHQKHYVYVDVGEFRLEVCCHKDFSAITMAYINDFNGPCTIQIRDDSILIKRSNGKEIGRWPYAFIREFRFDDDKFQFSFVSGRRGVFGVAQYLFKLHSRTYYNLKETVNRIAGGRAYDSVQAKPLYAEEKPPVPPHNKDSGYYKRQETAANQYDDVPAIRAMGHKRSSSNPDLSQELLRAASTKSTASDPPSCDSPPPTAKNKSRAITDTAMNRLRPLVPSEPSSPLLMQRRSSEYQVPKLSDYHVPRPYHDPRNDYQIPKPIDEAYMAPRSWLGVASRPVVGGSNQEHGYEDLDKLNQS